jgi:hypothetical protein
MITDPAAFKQMIPGNAPLAAVFGPFDIRLTCMSYYPFLLDRVKPVLLFGFSAFCASAQHTPALLPFAAIAAQDGGQSYV